MVSPTRDPLPLGPVRRTVSSFYGPSRRRSQWRLPLHLEQHHGRPIRDVSGARPNRAWRHGPATTPSRAPRARLRTLRSPDFKQESTPKSRLSRTFAPANAIFSLIVSAFRVLGFAYIPDFGVFGGDSRNDRARMDAPGVLGSGTGSAYGSNGRPSQKKLELSVPRVRSRVPKALFLPAKPLVLPAKRLVLPPKAQTLIQKAHVPVRDS